MTEMKIEYLGHFGTDLDVVNAARVSFANEHTVLDQSDEKLIEYLATGMRTKARSSLRSLIQACETDETADLIIDHIQAITKHWSPFTHCFAKFRIKVPIFVARQMQRSGVGFSPPLADDFGFSEESRRYVSTDPEFHRIKEWRGRAADVKQGSGGAVEPHFTRYMEHSQGRVIELAADTYDYAVRGGVSPEQARSVLPQNTMTTFIWTGTLYAWANLCRQRLDAHAQQEVQEPARAISAVMADLFPVSWRALVTRGKTV